jgi:hypothetical protein
MFLTLPLGFLTLVCFKTLENKTDIDKIPGKIFGNNINKLRENCFEEQTPEI